MGILEFMFAIIALVVIAFTILMAITIICDSKNNNVNLERQNVKLKQQVCKEEYTKNNIKMEDK